MRKLWWALVVVLVGCSRPVRPIPPYAERIEYLGVRELDDGREIATLYVVTGYTLMDSNVIGFKAYCELPIGLSEVLVEGDDIAFGDAGSWRCARDVTSIL